jgi:hypothetical protein
MRGSLRRSARIKAADLPASCCDTQRPLVVETLHRGTAGFALPSDGRGDDIMYMGPCGLPSANANHLSTIDERAAK